VNPPPKFVSSNKLSVVINAVAERIAADPLVPEENRQALRDTAVTVIQGEFSAQFGWGEALFFLPKVWLEQRRARSERVAAALSAGEAAESIARREKISPRHLRRLRGRIG
jgi:hypothetical protein